MKRESFANAFTPGATPAPQENWGFKLPQLLCVWEVERECKRLVRSTMTLVAVEQAQFGKKLSCKYLFEASSTVTDALIESLGFDSKRLRAMEIVPSAIKLYESEVTKEFASATLERSQRELFEKFKRWITKRDFSALIYDQVQRAAKRGPQSRFSWEP